MNVAVGPFTVKAAAHGFVNSDVVATNFKNVSLASVDTANGGTAFGFDFHGTFGRLKVKNPALVYDRGAGGTQPLQADFEVKRV